MKRCNLIYVILLLLWKGSIEVGNFVQDFLMMINNKKEKKR